ncbi:MAG: ATPase P [Lachnospiraceae bacterium]|nr:ATPase P [Lachnospiraceae bacterium]
MYKTTLKIDGMMCGMCEAHVNDAIRKAVPSAKKLSTSHTKGESSFLTEEKPDSAGLQKAIGDTGYQVLSTETIEVEKKKGLFGIF